MSVQTSARRLAVAAGIGLSIAWLVWAFKGFSLSDADAYRLAAERLIHGQNIYVQPPNQDEAFRYAPWFAAAWVPIAALPEPAGDALWVIVLGCASLVAVLPLARRPSLAARLLAVLGASVLLWTTARGNVHPLVMVALIHGLERRSGPLWVALAASLKAAPIFFVLVYLAKHEWWRAALALAITAVLVLPMPFLGWQLGAVDAGASVSLYYLVSPLAWAVAAVVAGATAIALAFRSPRYSAVSAAVAAVLSLPRLLLYDLTDLLAASIDLRPAQGLDTQPASRPASGDVAMSNATNTKVGR
jgi:hypothetical protein